MCIPLEERFALARRIVDVLTEDQLKTRAYYGLAYDELNNKDNYNHYLKFVEQKEGSNCS